MKKRLRKVRKILANNLEDIAYLIIAGLPTGMFLILFGKLYEFGEVF